MLAASPHDVAQVVWPRLASRTQLPCSEEEFLAVSGAAPASGDSRRKYHRFHLREQAVLRYAAGTFAVYTKDVSRMGMGVMVPEQLFPCDEFELLMPGEQWISLIVRRCRRVQEECYDVGAEFAAGILNPGRYKQMIQHVGL